MIAGTSRKVRLRLHDDDVHDGGNNDDDDDDDQGIVITCEFLVWGCDSDVFFSVITTVSVLLMVFVLQCYVLYHAY